MSTRNSLLKIVTLLALFSVASSAQGRQKGMGPSEEELELAHRAVSLGIGVDLGYLAGDAVTARLGETKSRFLGGGGIRLEYRLSPVVRVDAGFDALFGGFFEYGSRGRGYSYSVGCRLVHQPMSRSSLFLRGELGLVKLGAGEDYKSIPAIDRSSTLIRIGIGQQYYVSASNATHVELLGGSIRTSDGKQHPYVGVTNENVYYILLRISWIFGL